MSEAKNKIKTKDPQSLRNWEYFLLIPTCPWSVTKGGWEKEAIPFGSLSNNMFPKSLPQSKQKEKFETEM